MKRYLTEAEQRQLLTTIKRVADPLARRDFHAFSALILTGMRIREFSALTAPQVRQALACGWLVSLKENCKGRRHTNEYLVTHPLRQHLQALLEISDELARAIEHAEGAMQPLVWGRDVGGLAGHLSVRSYEARLKEWAVAAQLDPRISPHWLRHTRGMNVINRTRGKDGLRVAKLALNHQSIRSTGIYTQMSREQYEREIRMVDGGRVPRRVARQMAAQAVL
ncbi:tyrosine-type recombinase/integrase [Aquabacterium sp.]|uniref:tyrosine-type recombinase/integrase n=1 Tax=Aquabacterium sp. TaxID=1872578 RepID=UPI0025C283AF|nr:tyrosine-type recombinase/integrase [Aquabacterium sp.]